jgi:colanic acid biosynthesis glycosyl transferase WcaI
MKVLVHDFAGHPFAAQLSRSLARRGHHVVHAHCGGVPGGRGALAPADGDPPTLGFCELHPESFERYAAADRVRAEIRYGRMLAALAERCRPDVIVSANTPLMAQSRLWRAGAALGARRIYWLQDFLGRGTRGVLAERSAVLEHTAGRGLEALERTLLRRSEAIVAITEDFVTTLETCGVRVPVAVVENWAPLDEVAVRPKDNPWARSLDLHRRPVAVYAGTLGLKHDPEHLVAAAVEVAALGGRVVVASEGLGREHLERRRAELDLEALVLVDFVPYERLPDLLGAADVGLVLLEAEAGTFSVPSKVLSYMAAGRPVAAAMPPENLGARTIATAGAGRVVPPGDHHGFASLVARMLRDPATPASGAAARRYAERHFDIEAITDRVEAVLVATDRQLSVAPGPAGLGLA